PSVPPNHRLPSRSSKIARTPPGALPAVTRLEALEPRRVIPAVVETQRLESRSRARARIGVRASAAATPLRVMALPFQCARPESVPIHNSELGPGSNTFTFWSGEPA